MEKSERYSRHFSGLHRIVTCISRSPRSDALLAESQRIASILGAVHVLVHVGDASCGASHDISQALERVGIEQESVEIVFLTGRIADSICSFGEEINASVIIAGARERESALKYFIGSVARRIARNSTQSVLLLTEPRLSPTPFRSIGVTIDFDPSSQSALELGIAFARADHAAEFFLLHEYQVPAALLGSDDGIALDNEPDAFAMIESEEHARLLAYAEGFDFAGVSAELLTLRGRKGWEAAEFAHTRKLDLLIAPAPPRRFGLFDKLFQHDIEYTLESLPCAFFISRQGLSQAS